MKYSDLYYDVDKTSVSSARIGRSLWVTNFPYELPKKYVEKGGMIMVRKLNESVLTGTVLYTKLQELNGILKSYNRDWDGLLSSFPGDAATMVDNLNEIIATANSLKSDIIKSYEQRYGKF